jgi:hypothetical protein
LADPYRKMRFRVTIAALVAVVASLAASQAAAAPGPPATVLLAVRALPAMPAMRQPEPKPKPKPRGFLVARLRRSVGVAGRPGGSALGRFGAKTEFGSPRVLSVARVRGPWLGVVSPASSNGRLAWVRRDRRSLSLGRVATALRADLSARTVELRRRGRTVERVRVAVGRPGSPTPTGRFAITDRLSGARFGPYYGCCVLALSGYQPRPPSGWQGGNRLAIHGTNTPGAIGAAASAGCLRASDADLAKLIRRVPLGAPVFVHS